MRLPAFVILAITLSACATRPFTAADYIQKKGLNGLQTSKNFQHCYNYGCKDIATVSLSDGEWAYIKAEFDDPQTAAAERASIAQAIAVFENIIGAKTGTEADKAGTYADIALFSHDCVDESINTIIYLTLLRQNDLLKFHSVNPVMARIPIMQGRFAPHQTAVITENATGARYAVDSWFHDNGTPAEIVALEIWKKGWHPPKEPRADKT